MNNDERKLWVLLVVLVAVVAFSTGYLMQYAKPFGPEHPSATSKPLLVGGADHPASGPVAGEPTADAGFSSAMDGLQAAIGQHPGVSKRELILRANTNSPDGMAKPCPFTWKNDQAELMLHKDERGAVSLVNTLRSCADAIRKLP